MVNHPNRSKHPSPTPSFKAAREIEKRVAHHAVSDAVGGVVRDAVGGVVRDSTDREEQDWLRNSP